MTNFNNNFRGIKYNPGGSGRDTYIINDNGGFNALFQPRKQDQPTSFLPNVNRMSNAAQKFASSDHMAKSVRYKSDGTGRDSYACAGDGGFTNPGMSSVVGLDPRIAFTRNLRNYGQDSEYLDRRNRRIKHIQNV